MTRRHPARARLTRRVIAASFAVVAVLFGGVVGFADLATAAAADAPAGITAATVGATPTIGPDCKGDPPLPQSPYGLLAVKPQTTSTADPFASDTTSIQSVYGTNFGWWTYDNGCAAGSGILPSLGTNIATLIGFQIPGLAPNWGQSLMSAVVNPTWTHQLDSVVRTTTTSTTAGVWYPWLAVALTVIAVILLVRALRGALPAVITGLVWALLVLVVVSWTVNYPTESTDLLDSGIQSAVVSTATGFSDGMTAAGPDTGQGTAQTPGQQAQASLDREWDLMVRTTLYRSWLQGAFASADSQTATTYGPPLFKATHFSWAEYDIYQADPTGQGKTLVDSKAAAFRQIADQIQTSDPVAYNSFTGNDYMARVGIGFLSLVEVIVVAWFLLVAAVVILLSYLLIRLVIPIAPAAGVFFMVEPLRDMALGWLRRIAGLLVMGPLFFLAALIVGRFNSAIMGSDLNSMLKLIFVGAIAVLAWKLLRPQSMAGRVRIPGLAALASYIGSRKGVADGEEESAKKKKKNGGDTEDDEPNGGPVHVGTPLAITRKPSAHEPPPAYPPPPSAEPIVFTATTASTARSAPELRDGTFAPRSPSRVAGGARFEQPGQVGDAAQTRQDPRSLRALSAVPTPRERPNTVVLTATPQAIDAAASDTEAITTTTAGERGIASADPSRNGTSRATTQTATGRTDPAPASGSPGTSSPVAGPASSSDQPPPAIGTTVLEGGTQLPDNVNVANVTWVGGRQVFEIYNPERGPSDLDHGGVVYGS